MTADGAFRWTAQGDMDPIDVLCRRIVTLGPCDMPRDLAREVEAGIQRCVAELDRDLDRDAVRGLHNTLLHVGGRPESRVAGRGFRLPAHEAATFNVAASWMPDRDDRRFVAPAVWSALATSDALGGVPAAAFTTAIALSVDLGRRLQQATPDAGAQGHHDAIYAGFVAAACAAKLRGFSSDALRNALGIMLSQAAGTTQATRDHASGDQLQIAFNVGDGLKSVMLASVGVTGVRRVASGEFSFLKLFSRSPDPRPLTSDLHHVWSVRGRFMLSRSPGVSVDAQNTLARASKPTSGNDPFDLFEPLFSVDANATGNTDE